MELAKSDDELTRTETRYITDAYGERMRPGLALPRTYWEQEAVRGALEWARLSRVDAGEADAVRQQMQARLATITCEVVGRVDAALRPLGNTPHKIFRPKSPESIIDKLWRRGDDRRPLSDLSGVMLVVRQERGVSEEVAKQGARNTLSYLQGYFHVPPAHPNGTPTLEEDVAPWSNTGFVRRSAKLWTEVDGCAELFEVQAYTGQEFREYVRTWRQYEAERPKVPVAELGKIALLYA